MSLIEKAELAFARFLFRLSPPLQVKLSGRAPVTVGEKTLHPEMQLLLALRKLRGAGTLRADTASESRRRMRSETLRFAGRPEPVGSVSDFTVPAPHGPIPVRHYAPAAEATPTARDPLLVFFHGGGFVAGDLDTHDGACRLLCRQAQVHVLSVDYRLAPEHPFPAAITDAQTVLQWAFDHAAELGADSERVAVGGDSAGGNISAVLAYLAAREGTRAPHTQLLIYPVVTTENRDTRASMRSFASGFILERADIEWFDDCYRVRVGVPGKDPRVSPLEADDHRGLCPAIVVTAGFDPLCDEGDAYAERLRAAGVEVEHLRLPGFVHGFIQTTGVSPGSYGELAGIADALRRRLAR